MSKKHPRARPQRTTPDEFIIGLSGPIANCLDKEYSRHRGEFLRLALDWWQRSRAQVLDRCEQDRVSLHSQGTRLAVALKACWPAVLKSYCQIAEGLLLDALAVAACMRRERLADAAELRQSIEALEDDTTERAIARARWVRRDTGHSVRIEADPNGISLGSIRALRQLVRPAREAVLSLHGMRSPQMNRWSSETSLWIDELAESPLVRPAWMAFGDANRRTRGNDPMFSEERGIWCAPSWPSSFMVPRVPSTPRRRRGARSGAARGILESIQARVVEYRLGSLGRPVRLGGEHPFDESKHDPALPCNAIQRAAWQLALERTCPWKDITAFENRQARSPWVAARVLDTLFGSSGEVASGTLSAGNTVFEDVTWFAAMQDPFLLWRDDPARRGFIDQHLPKPSTPARAAFADWQRTGRALSPGDARPFAVMAMYCIQSLAGQNSRLAKPAGGRRQGNDPDEDARITQRWQTDRYKTYVELGKELGLSHDQVKRALDRHRKRV